MAILLGDCLTKLKDIQTESVDLIYLDPPFFTQKVHSLKNRDNTKEYSFEDKWSSIEKYKEYIEERLYECNRVLKSSGSIFLHCDKWASHYLRLALDNTFGYDNFRSEIIWHYKRWSNSKKGLLNNHQTIYFYSKTDNFKFNTVYMDYSLSTNIDQILQERKKDENGKSVYKRDENGQIVVCKSKKGVPLGDVWELPYLNPKAKERAGYPTQKPILLLERIIELVTDEGDVVLDPFLGSGTTVVAAKLLKRNYIGIDISIDAVNLTNDRLDKLIKTESTLIKKGRQSYQNLNDEEMSLLKQLNATPVQRNSGIDGFLKDFVNELPVAIRIQRKDEHLEEAKTKLLRASKKKNCSCMILLRTHIDEVNSIFNIDQDERLFIIDAYDIHINNIRKQIESRN